MSEEKSLESLIRPLIPAFLEGRREDCRTLEVAIRAGDAAVLQNLGHRLVGSGASYGFARISELGAVLETAARERDFEAASRAVEALAAVVAEAMNVDD